MLMSIRDPLRSNRYQLAYIHLQHLIYSDNQFCKEFRIHFSTFSFYDHVRKKLLLRFIEITGGNRMKQNKMKMLKIGKRIFLSKQNNGNFESGVDEKIPNLIKNRKFFFRNIAQHFAVQFRKIPSCFFENMEEKSLNGYGRSSFFFQTSFANFTSKINEIDKDSKLQPSEISDVSPRPYDY